MTRNHYIIEFSCPGRWSQRFRSGTWLEGDQLLGWHTIQRGLEERAVQFIEDKNRIVVNGSDLNFHVIALVLTEKL